ncbi:MAG TPA: MotA/TolQ/ExbB proton channel family protein [Spirochaetota bacterium]|nr:MotA/TolQ/ExbB proton channel family protein [Spirochaetota bacterium]HPI91011.1 MotA/TolQ/ExbB proton channel family protein [Spirochaetota bacterium]HPR48608.1 MotA/TolQ/ExbB proton channel family protein [Spirochaetota bacterium]
MNKRTCVTLFTVVMTLLLITGLGHAQQNNTENQTNLIEAQAGAQSVVVDQGIAPPDSESAESTEAKGGSLFATVKQGGPLMILIVLLGLMSLTIIIERLIFYTKHEVWKSDRIEMHLREAAQKSSASFREDLEDEMRAIFSIYANSLERGLALLSGIGNIAPVIGFLGTVIGMISAFASIAAATTVNAKVVAVGIQVALVTTAGGLIVAAPTLLFFYFFTHVIQNRYALAEEIISGVTDTLPRLSDRLCEEPAPLKPAQRRTRAPKAGN